MTRALLLTLSLFSLRAHGFADMVRHGFPNCISCHTSATGGGLLTEYGRSISAELLSTWRSPGEERFDYAMKPSEVVSLGGDLRTALFQQNRATVRSTKILLMHADVEAGVTLGPVTAVARLPSLSPEPWVAVATAPPTEMCGSEAMLWRANPCASSASASA